MKRGDHELKLRPMTAADIPRVHEIETASFQTPWSEDSFQGELNNLCARYSVLTEDGAIVGFAGMWLILDEAHVNNVAVDPAYRGRGYGKLLMRELMRGAYRALEITRMTLEVRVSNETALTLYRGMGFSIAGRRKGYYEDTGEDAYIMWCENTLENLI